VLRRNCLLKDVIEGKIERRIEVTGRRGRRLKQLLDDLKAAFRKFFGHETLYNLVNIYGTRMFCGSSFINYKSAQGNSKKNSYMNNVFNCDLIC
jgi:hypothetical protein